MSRNSAAKIRTSITVVMPTETLRESTASLWGMTAMMWKPSLMAYIQ